MTFVNDIGVGEGVGVGVGETVEVGEAVGQPAVACAARPSPIERELMSRTMLKTEYFAAFDKDFLVTKMNKVPKTNRPNATKAKPFQPEVPVAARQSEVFSIVQVYSERKS